VPIELGPPDATQASVGVIDSGVDASHPQIKGLLVDQKDFTGEGLGDSSGHGTNVILAFIASFFTEDANKVQKLLPGVGLRGIASAKVVGRAPAPPAIVVDRIVAAIQWLAGRQVKIVNMSIAMPDGAAPFDPLCAAIAANPAMLFAVASGNYGEGSRVF